MRERRTGNSMAGSGSSCDVRTGKTANGCVRGGRSETVCDEEIDLEGKLLTEDM